MPTKNSVAALRIQKRVRKLDGPAGLKDYKALPDPHTDVRDLARSMTPVVLERLLTIAEHSKNDSAAVKACEVILNRGWGKVGAQLEAEQIPMDRRIQIAFVGNAPEGAVQITEQSVPHEDDEEEDDDDC